MARTKLIKKGIRIIKKDGPKTFGKKLLKFSTKKAQVTALRVLPLRLQKRFDVFDEEYGFVANPIFQITTRDIEDSLKATSGKKPEHIKTATWFVPYFDHLAFGGIYTIFRFINYLDQQGVKNNIVIYDNADIEKSKLEAEVRQNFPGMKNSYITILDSSQDMSGIGESDIAFCTIWVSAYFLLKFNKTKRKYYFIQDYEPLFYTAGATYALAESTYRFGFKGIVNTPGLLAAVNQRHGLEGVSFKPAVDRSIYHPPAEKDNKRIRIFFYARPNNPRNAFNLGVQIIKELIDRYDNKIEIVTAGASWKERQYGLRGLITNKGLIKTIPEVADLYRTCDIGFVYMLTKHPSYQPFEFMASGVATVTNYNEDNLWFLKHEENCLMAEPSPAAMVEQICRLIEDEELRKKLIAGGLKSVENEWDWQTKIIWNDISANH